MLFHLVSIDVQLFNILAFIYRLDMLGCSERVLTHVVARVFIVAYRWFIFLVCDWPVMIIT